VNSTPIHTVEERAPARLSTLLALDPLLLLGAMGLVGCSMLTLGGATRTLQPGGSYYVERQGLYAAAGLVLALLLARLDYTRLREYRYAFFGLLLGLNLVVYGMPQVQGATRWIPLPWFQFQPSEFGKVLLIVALAAFAVDRGRRLHEHNTTARIMLLGLVAAMFVIPQPDLGTGLVYVAIAFAILFFAGTNWRQLTALVALFGVAVAMVIAVAPAVGVNVLKGYQKERLTTFIDPPRVCSEKDTSCYQLQESVIAIGSGQKTGRGVAGATQASLGYLPEAQDDLIFAVVGETYGFLGAAVVLSLYALLIWRTLRIMTMAKNLFGTLIAGGILAMLMFQMFVNVGSTLGIMPLTGVPLPLLSYGGSSVLVTFMCLGLLQSIHIQARLTAAGKGRTLI
jgi:rod shape determining protein RodA